MADGFRILEDGSSRILESSDFRITEQFAVGEVALTATGIQASVGFLSTTGSASLSGAGSKITVGLGELKGLFNVSASSSISSIGKTFTAGESALSAEGTLTNTGLRTAFAESSLSTNGSQLAAAERIVFGVVSSEDFESVRVLENGDTRVTEAGDTRITLDATNNIIGSIVSEPTHTVFTSTAYYNDDDTWKTFIPYVKYGGAWKDNVRIYKNQNGTWKRSY